MTARDARGILTTQNIVQAVDECPEMVFDEIQNIIDNEHLDIPDRAVSADNIRKLQELQAYYSNQYSYVMGLWGALSYATDRTDTKRIKMRDYLEKAVSACSKRYDAASRLLTGYQQIRDDTRGTRGI